MKFCKHYCCCIVEMKINFQESNRYVLATQPFKRNNYLCFDIFKRVMAQFLQYALWIVDIQWML